MGVVTRLFGWLVPERELTVEPRFHPYYPGELPGDELLNKQPGA